MRIPPDFSRGRLPYFSAVWVSDIAGGHEVFNKAGDKTLDAQRKRKSFSIFNDNGDGKFYLGLENRFDMAGFYGVDANKANNEIVWEYLDAATHGIAGADPTSAPAFKVSDDAWTEFVPYYEYAFGITGVESFTDLFGWKPAILEGGLDSKARYWVRASSKDPSRISPTVTRIEARPYAAYCSPEDVVDLLQIPNFEFSADTIPTRETVEDAIYAAQSLIDSRTFKSWRLNYVENEVHEYLHYGLKLRKRYVREVAELSIWDGSAYEVKRQGRNEEYVLIPEYGRIIFTRFFFLPARLLLYNQGRLRHGFGEFKEAVHVSYLYGRHIHEDAEFGGVVWDLARKRAAMTLLVAYDFNLLTVSGADRVSLESKYRLWSEEVEDKLDHLRGWAAF